LPELSGSKIVIISKLHLMNFRNFASKKIEFDPKLTVIIGQNGSGKSNILEAIGLMAATRLRRVDTDLDMVRFGAGEAKIECIVGVGEAGRGTLTINFQVDPNVILSEAKDLKRDSSSFGLRMTGRGDSRLRKSYYIDAIKKRWIDFTDHMAVIEFSPSDLELISGSPSTRRHHIDSLLAPLDRDYWRASSNYGKVVVRRNKVLQRIREGKSKKSELDFWDERLLEHAKFLTRARAEFFEFVNFVNSERGGYSWDLKQSVVTSEKLAVNRDRDIAAGVTLSGSHRDDFMFVFRKKNLEFFGSRGEQRMAVLALKLAELEYFASKKGSRPVLALDDIFSELDWEHREAVMGIIEKQQTIITAAESESLPAELFKKAKVVKI